MSSVASTKAALSQLIAPQRDIVRRGRWSSLLPAGNRVESTVRYLGIDVEDALGISEQVEI
jgi:hypothetical protein